MYYNELLVKTTLTTNTVVTGKLHLLQVSDNDDDTPVGR